MPTLAHLMAKISIDGAAQAEAALGRVGNAFADTGRKAQQSGGLSKAASLAFAGIGTAAVAISLNAVAQGFAAVADAVMTTNADLQTSAVAWETLLGSVGAADAKTKELYVFAAATPLTFGSLDGAARQLETFGGAALNTKANLELLGDAAAGVARAGKTVDAAFAETVQWSSRLYDALQSGQPIGEAVQNLTQLGLISGQTATQLKNLQAAGASGPELWAAYAQSLERFDGLMAKQAQTFSGMASTFSDGVRMMAATAGKPIFDKLTAGLSDVNDWLASPDAARFGDQLARGASTALAAFDPLIDAASDLASGFVDFVNGDTFIPWVTRASDDVRQITSDIRELVEGAGNLAGALSDAGQPIADFFNQVQAKSYASGQELRAFLGLTSNPLPLAADTSNGTVEKTTAAVSGMTAAIDDQKAAADDWKTSMDAAGGAVRAAQLDIDRATLALAPFEASIKAAEGAVDAKERAIRAAEAALKPFADAVSAAEQNVAAQERTIRLATAALKPFEQDVQAATAAVADQEAAISQAEQQLRPFANAVAVANAAVAGQERVVRQAESALKPYADAVTAADRAVTSQQRAIKEAEAALKPYADAVTGTQQAYDDQARAVANAERALAPYEAAVKSAQSALDDQRAATDNAKAGFDNLRAGISDAQSAMDKWRNEPLEGEGAFADKLNTINDRADKLKLRLANMQLSGAPAAQIDALEKQLERLNKQAERVQLQEKVSLGPARREIEQFGKATQEFTKDQIIAGMTGAQKAIAELTAQLGPAEQAWKDQVAAQDEATAAVTRAQKALADQQAAIQPLRDALAGYKSDVDLAKDALIEHDKAIDPLRAKLSDLQLAADAARDAFVRENEAINPLRDDLALLKEQAQLAADAFDNQNKAIDPLRDGLRFLRDDVSEAQRALDLQNKAIDPLRDNLVLLAGKVDDATVAYDAANAKIDPLRTSLAILNGVVDDAKTALQGQKDAIDPLRTKLAELQTAFAETQGTYNTEMDALRLLKKSYDDVTSSVGKMKDTVGGDNNSSTFYPDAPGDDHSSDAHDRRDTGRAYTRGSALTDQSKRAGDNVLSDAAIDLILKGGRQSDGYNGHRDYNNDGKNQGASELHQGIDLAGVEGMNVRAPTGGKVVFAGPNEFGGSAVIIEGSDGRQYYYGHLRGDLDVKAGQNLEANSVIGQISGKYNHTHLQVRENGKNVDPTKLLEQRAYATGSGPGDDTAAGQGAVTGAVDAAKNWATDATSFMEFVDVAMATLQGIKKYKGVSRDAVLLFVDDINGFVETFRVTVQDFDVAGMKAANDWVKAAGAILDVVGDGVFALTQLNSYEGTTRDAVLQFGQDLYGFVTTLAVIVRDFDRDGLKAANDWVDAAGNILAIVGQGVDTLHLLNEYEGTTRDAVLQFGHDVHGFVATLAVIVRDFDRDALAAANEWVDAASGVLGIVGQGIEALAQVTKYKGTPSKAAHLFAEDLNLFVTAFATAVAHFDEDALEAASLWVDSAGAVLGIVGQGVDALSLIRRYKGVPVAAIELFVGDLLVAVTRLQTASERFTTEGTAAAAEITANMGAIVQVIGTGVDAFTLLQTYKGVPGANIQLFADDLRTTVEHLVAMASSFEAEGVTAGAVFAGAVGTMVGGIAAGVDAFTALQTYRGVPAARMTAFFGDLRAMTTQLVALSGQFEEDGLAAGVVFADAVGAILQPVGAALEVLGTLGAVGEDGAASFRAPSQEAIQQLATGIRDIVGALVAVAGELDAEGVAAGAAFGDAVTHILAPVSTALDVLGKLGATGEGAYQGVSREQVLHIANDIRGVVATFGVIAAELEGEGLAAATRFSEGAGSVLGAVASATGAIAEIGSYQGFAPDTMDRFLRDFGAVVTAAGTLHERGKEARGSAELWRDDMFAYRDAIRAGVAAMGDVPPVPPPPANAPASPGGTPAAPGGAPTGSPPASGGQTAARGTTPPPSEQGFDRQARGTTGSPVTFNITINAPDAQAAGKAVLQAIRSAGITPQ